MLCKCGKILYKILGWSYDDLPDYWTHKQVVIGFPHTSNFDTCLAFAYIKLAKVNAKLLVKQEWFFWPMSLLLKSLGGIPVRREKASGVVDMVAGEFKKRDEFVLALVPEGTRKNATRIRTGFWNIAKKAGVPIVCWYLDHERKRTRWLGCILPGESLDDDLLKIKALYEKEGYSIPYNKPVNPQAR
jgi:1-acyl-sn-glycerol-3-phosphate acyltransferase